MSHIFFQLTVCLTLIKAIPLVQMRVFGYRIKAATVELLSFTFEDGKHVVSVHYKMNVMTLNYNWIFPLVLEKRTAIYLKYLYYL